MLLQHSTQHTPTTQTANGVRFWTSPCLTSGWWDSLLLQKKGERTFYGMLLTALDKVFCVFVWTDIFKRCLCGQNLNNKTKQKWRQTNSVLKKMLFTCVLGLRVLSIVSLFPLICASLSCSLVTEFSLHWVFLGDLCQDQFLFLDPASAVLGYLCCLFLEVPSELSAIFSPSLLF